MPGDVSAESSGLEVAPSGASSAVPESAAELANDVKLGAPSADEADASSDDKDFGGPGTSAAEPSEAEVARSDTPRAVHEIETASEVKSGAMCAGEAEAANH